MTTVLFAVLIGGAALALGCGAPSDGIMPGPPDFEGFITAIEPAAGGTVLGTILVESHADKRVRRIIVTVTSDTAIVRRDGTETRRAGFDVLHLRNRVQLWFAGPVRGRFPQEGTAKQVLVAEGH
jgi:hypothetical protein